MKDALKYSVIIPTLNAEATLRQTLNSLDAVREDVEVMVVDGGSSDLTCSLALDMGVKVELCRRGRGHQLAHGARLAQGDIFLFLHADTQLPENTFNVLDDYFKEPHHYCGLFQMKFDQNHWLLNFYSQMTRHDSLWTSFGDQGITVRKDFYESLGGFPEWLLFEDVDFLRRARKKEKIASFPVEVTTSAERFLRNGLIQQQLKNGWLILQYLCGVENEKLSYSYNLREARS